jgi:NAD(P)-dependent dehydrogenase (short-subunit alcohol dehydrogenase family)
MLTAPDMDNKFKEQLATKIPAGRFGNVDEVAHAAQFLVENTYANNCILNLDGGLSAWTDV